MKDLRLEITINAPIKDVFWYSLNPENTPKWVGGIKSERTSEWPVKLGTAYENTWDGSTWSRLYVSDFHEPTTFTLTKEDGSYSVRYTFRSLSAQETEFEYYEWTSTGDLESPFGMEYLKKLKAVAEDELG